MKYLEGNKETSAIYYGEKVITAVYHGLRLIWEAIRSCFGSGSWIEEYPWVDDDPWADN